LTGRSINGDPQISFRFVVKIDQNEACGFSEAIGLSSEKDVETFREGGVNECERTLPGATKFPAKLVLKRGMTTSNVLWNWYKQAMQGDIRRKSISVHLQDHAGNQKRTWVFNDACPVKWTGPEFKAETAAIAFESVELIHRGFETR
jgi:phage tail-like protein